MGILQRILEAKRVEIADALRAKPIAAWRDEAAPAQPGPPFRAALERAPGPAALIAEVKRASPSKGLIREDFDPAAIAEAYQRGGADALSVLTDRQFFRGGLEVLRAVRAACPLPCLRKDFLLDEVQLAEARIAGASAVLLIAAAMPGGELARLHGLALEYGLEVLVEVHDEAETESVLAHVPDVSMLGVNNRNLETFEVDLSTTARLAPMAPKGALLVAESGISAFADVEAAARAGAKAVLVGEGLMRQPDIAKATRELLGR